MNIPATITANARTVSKTERQNSIIILPVLSLAPFVYLLLLRI